ncbi:DUF6912 family protein [Streptomyces catenulae]|uniref:Uncharacterized protein n=1 Tax=Streptomyces catenulae TaxID=66875 RepID=A0ABV2Z894_9ACTN|nr:hypothetical protein [Streptomyces catenulae]
MRVYVPLTLPGLAEVHGKGELGPGPLDAYAVTPALRAWLSDDIEELEYTALGYAAQASLRQLAARPDAARRRVVVAVDVPDAAVTAAPGGAEDPAAVRVTGPVPMKKAAAVHVDASDAERAVAAAATALAAADGGDEAALRTVEGAEDHDLMWFGVQEIPALLG